MRVVKYLALGIFYLYKRRLMPPRRQYVENSSTMLKMGSNRAVNRLTLAPNSVMGIERRLATLHLLSCRAMYVPVIVAPISFQSEFL